MGWGPRPSPVRTYARFYLLLITLENHWLRARTADTAEPFIAVRKESFAFPTALQLTDKKEEQRGYKKIYGEPFHFVNLEPDRCGNHEEEENVWSPSLKILVELRDHNSREERGAKKGHTGGRKKE